MRPRTGDEDPLADGPVPAARIGILGLSERNFDLLPALYRDPRAAVLWVRAEDAASPLARLAELLEFHVVEDPQQAAEVDVLVVRGAEALRSGGMPQPGGLRPSRGRRVARVVSESGLRDLLRAGRFEWERLRERKP